MKPVSFKYFAPTSVAEAVAVLGQYGSDAKIIAGGQSLMPLLNMRLARPTVLVDINRVGELNYLRAAGDGIAVGATARQCQLERDPLVTQHAPLLESAVKLMSHPQIRNRGTIVGSIAHGDPSAELPAVALVLNAEITAMGPHGARTLSVDALYLGYLATSLEPEEVITEVRFPAPPHGAGWSVREIARRHGDFALAGVAALLRLDGARIAEARLAYFGLGARALRLAEVEMLLAGAFPSSEVFAAAADKAAAVLEPPGDIHASATYRRSMAAVLTRRTLNEALERATGGASS